MAIILRFGIGVMKYYCQRIVNARGFERLRELEVPSGRDQMLPESRSVQESPATLQSQIQRPTESRAEQIITGSER